MKMKGEKEEDEEDVSHEETGECKVIIGKESQLHPMPTELFEEIANAAVEQPEAVNAATLLLLKGEGQNNKEKRR